MQHRKPRTSRRNAADLVEELLAELEGRRATNPEVRVAHGRSVDALDDGDIVRIRDPQGAVELEIRITPRGPQLRIEGASLELVAARSIDLRCETLSIEAELGASITARRGDVRIDAGDDVVVTGERVLLN